MTVREIEKLMREAGWYPVAQRGSHKFFKHGIYPNKVTVPQHKGDLHIDTVKAIFKQARLGRGGTP